jgi:hypothetical protein
MPIYEAKRKDIASRLRNLAGKRRVSTRGMFARIVALAQNTIARAVDLGTQAFEDDNPDLVDGFTWHISKLSPDVCDTCMAKNGKWYPSQGMYKRPPQHLHCYCFSLAKKRSLFDMGGEVPGPTSLRPYGEWALDAGVSYDGGLGSLPMARKGGKWRVRVPHEHTPKKVSLPPEVSRTAIGKARHAAAEWARRNVKAIRVAPKGWASAARWGQESVAKVRARELVIGKIKTLREDDDDE